MSGMYRNRIKKGKSFSSRWRLSTQRIIQVAAAVLFNGYLIGFQKGRIYTGSSKAICVPVLNCYSCPGALGACPIGALQNALGARHRHIPFYVLGMLMLFGVLFGRLICGLLCPFGLVQDLLYPIRRLPVWRLRKRQQEEKQDRKQEGEQGRKHNKQQEGEQEINRKRRWKQIGKKLDRYARYLKYGILLVFVLLLPAFVANQAGIRPPWFCQYICPAGTLGGGIPGLLQHQELRAAAGLLWKWKLFVLLVIGVASVMIHRPFCRYLCPLGAFYALFQRFSFFQMKFSPSRCVDCGACEQVCPMEVEVTKQINSPECIRCGACKAICPTEAISAVFLINTKERHENHK